jgi:transposase InsO family protein
MEESACIGPTCCLARGHRPNPQNELGQSSVGRTPNPRGATEAGVPAVKSHGCQVHGPWWEAVFSDVAGISPKPCEGSGGRRLLRGSNGFLRPVVCLRDFVARSPRPLHFAVTEHPTTEWTARQLLEAFPWDSGPRYLLRDRDGSYGEKFREAANWLRIREVLTAPQSPWKNAYVQRLIGSIRRECLDHVIVLNDTGLRRVLKSYFDYYEQSRTHLSLGKDAPISRPIQPAAMGPVVKIPQVGGLHHRYESVAA